VSCLSQEKATAKKKNQLWERRRASGVREKWRNGGKGTYTGRREGISLSSKETPPGALRRRQIWRGGEERIRVKRTSKTLCEEPVVQGHRSWTGGEALLVRRKKEGNPIGGKRGGDHASESGERTEGKGGSGVARKAGRASPEIAAHSQEKKEARLKEKKIRKGKRW